MTFTKYFAGFAMVAGMALSGASTLSAQGFYGSDAYRDRADLRADNRDLSRDYNNVARLRADIQRDEARRAEAWRCGRREEAYRISRDIERDRRILAAQRRDIRRDQYDASRDRRDLRNDYR